MEFVTGGSGFTGSHLICQLLIRGRNITALRRSDSDLQGFRVIAAHYGLSTEEIENKLRWIEACLEDPETYEAYLNHDTRVYHCAAEVGFGKDQKHRMQITNIQGTAFLVNTCIEKNILRMCHVSSIACLGSRTDGEPVTEEDDWQEMMPHSAYSRSKYLAELEVWRGIAEGLPAIIVNPSVITGPGGPKSSFSRMIKTVADGLSYYPPGSNAWVDVRDVAEAMILLTEDSGSEGQYILSGGNHTYKDVLIWIAEGLKTKSPSRAAGKTMMKAASVLLNIRQALGGKRNPMNSELVRISCNQFSCSSDRCISKTGFQFRSIRDSVMEASQLFLQIKEV